MGDAAPAATAMLIAKAAVRSFISKVKVAV
jgi:hypothetical protein